MVSAQLNWKRHWICTIRYSEREKQHSHNLLCVCAKLLQSCPTLCDPMDCSPPGSSVYGILQAKIMEWVAMPFFRDLSNPGVEPTFFTSPVLERQVLHHQCHLRCLFMHVCVQHIFFIYPSLDEHLGCFHVLAILNSAAVNIGLHVSFWMMVFYGYMPRRGFPGDAKW